MRWVTSRSLVCINQELAALCSSERNIFTSVECFTVDEREFPSSVLATKKGTDVRSGFSINHILPNATAPPPEHTRVLVEAISLAFPDYDFSTTDSTHFKPIDSPEAARSSILFYLSSAILVNDGDGRALWNKLDAEISPALCDIYSYEPNCADAFSENGVIWNCSYLFFNTKQRKVLLFHLRQGSIDLDDPDTDFSDEYAFNIL